MIPVIFINCKKFPFVDQIISGQKVYETRNRDTLGRFIGDRVALAETGHGKPVVRCYATINCSAAVYWRGGWESYRKDTCVPSGSSYDWNDSTKVKWLYHLVDVEPVTSPFFLPSDCRRHGRVWAELPELYVSSFGNTGGNVYCFSGLYKGKYWVFGSDYLDAFTVDPMNTYDNDGYLVDPNEYLIPEATDFPTWSEVLEAIRYQCSSATYECAAEVLKDFDLSASSHIL